jgi:putative Mn2+ efflux pump MntP
MRLITSLLRNVLQDALRDLRSCYVSRSAADPAKTQDSFVLLALTALVTNLDAMAIGVTLAFYAG